MIFKRLLGGVGNKITVAGIAGTLIFAFLWKNALEDVAATRAQAQAEAAAAANQRMEQALARQEELHEAQLAEAQARADRLAAAAEEAAARAQAVTERLSDLVAEQQEDETPEFIEWKDQPVPQSVVTRLLSVQD